MVTCIALSPYILYDAAITRICYFLNLCHVSYFTKFNHISIGNKLWFEKFWYIIFYKKFALCNITFESTLVPYREYLYFLKGLKSFAHCTTDPDWSKSIFLFVYVEFVFFPNIVELFNFSNSLIVYFSIDIVYSSLI